MDIHKEEKVYIPELIFGHLLTSSNYDDNEKKVCALLPVPVAQLPLEARQRALTNPFPTWPQVTGGRNGYGAKLANIFSTEFVIETCDGTRGRRYRQVFRSNMSVKEAPKITNCKATDNWTCITFKPDLAKFGMEALEDDTMALMRRRVYDLAGILGKGVKVGGGRMGGALVLR